MLPAKRCLGCNKAMPARGAASKGWEIIVEHGHTYRNCGCVRRGVFLFWVGLLKEQDRDYLSPRLRLTWRRLCAAGRAGE